jgi:dTDP-4-amino-4,6-dideoxygalactose transaminase
MMITADADRARRMRRQREIGPSPAVRRHVLAGHSAPHVLRQGGLPDGLTEQSAAAGRDRLLHLDRWQRRRQDIARRYDERLRDMPWVGLPHRPAPGTGVHGWHHYPVLVEGSRFERDSVVRALDAAGPTTLAPILPLHRLDYVREVCGPSSADLGAADRFVDRVVCLPIHPSQADSTVDRVAEVLEATLR